MSTPKMLDEKFIKANEDELSIIGLAVIREFLKNPMKTLDPVTEVFIKSFITHFEELGVSQQDALVALDKYLLAIK